MMGREAPPSSSTIPEIIHASTTTTTQIDRSINLYRAGQGQEQHTTHKRWLAGGCFNIYLPYYYLWIYYKTRRGGGGGFEAPIIIIKTVSTGRRSSFSEFVEVRGRKSLSPSNYVKKEGGVPLVVALLSAAGGDGLLLNYSNFSFRHPITLTFLLFQSDTTISSNQLWSNIRGDLHLSSFAFAYGGGGTTLSRWLNLKFREN